MEPSGFYLRVLNLLLSSFLDLVLQKSATKVTSINAAGDWNCFLEHNSINRGTLKWLNTYIAYLLWSMTMNPPRSSVWGGEWSLKNLSIFLKQNISWRKDFFMYLITYFIPTKIVRSVKKTFYFRWQRLLSLEEVYFHTP